MRATARALSRRVTLRCAPRTRHAALQPLTRRARPPGARGRACAGGRGGVVVCASDGVYERPTRTFTSYELSQNSLPNGFIEFIKSMALPLALVAALSFGVAFPDFGIAAKEAGAVQARARCCGCSTLRPVPLARVRLR